jgi:hypothetical protein
MLVDATGLSISIGLSAVLPRSRPPTIGGDVARGGGVAITRRAQSLIGTVVLHDTAVLHDTVVLHDHGGILLPVASIPMICQSLNEAYAVAPTATMLVRNKV